MNDDRDQPSPSAGDRNVSLLLDELLHLIDSRAPSLFRKSSLCGSRRETFSLGELRPRAR
jgi:hypothetical protein